MGLRSTHLAFHSSKSDLGSLAYGGTKVVKIQGAKISPDIKHKRNPIAAQNEYSVSTEPKQLPPNMKEEYITSMR